MTMNTDTHTEKVMLAIGDCNTMPDALMPQSEYLVEQVATYLREAGENITLVNQGQPMGTTREGLAIFHDRPIAAQYALINYGLVDAWITSFPQVYMSYYPKRLWRKYPLKLLKSLKKRLRKYHNYIPTGNVVGEQEYVSNLRKLIEGCHALNPNVIIMLWTIPFCASNETRNVEIMRYNTHIQTVAKELNCLLCDTNSLISNTNPAHYLDEVHLSPIAAKILGAAIGTLLLNHAI